MSILQVETRHFNQDLLSINYLFATVLGLTVNAQNKVTSPCFYEAGSLVEEEKQIKINKWMSMWKGGLQFKIC